MKPKTMILMIVAVTCGLGASYMTSRLLAERSEEAAEKVEILVAKKKLAMGETIKKPEDMFDVKKVDKGTEPKDAVAVNDYVKELKGKILTRSLQTGDALHADDVNPDTSLAAKLPDGFRAVGIRVDAASVAGGFASLPLSRVDVMWTVRRGDDKTSFSKLLLEDVLVLAADGTRVRTEGDSAMPANTVTLALKPEDCAKIELAKVSGTMTLALRKLGEKKLEHLPHITMEQNLSGERKDNTEEPSVASNPSEPPLAQVQLPKVTPMDPEKVAVIPQKNDPVLPPDDLKKHRVTVYNNDRIEVWEFTLDENDVVIQRRRVE
jgi:pilus assembly protein CpaB